MQVAFIRKNTSELGCKICPCCYFKDAEWLEVYIRDGIKEIRELHPPKGGCFLIQ